MFDKPTENFDVSSDLLFKKKPGIAVNLIFKFEYILAVMDTHKDNPYISYNIFLVYFHYFFNFYHLVIKTKFYRLYFSVRVKNCHNLYWFIQNFHNLPFYKMLLMPGYSSSGYPPKIGFKPLLAKTPLIMDSSPNLVLILSTALSDTSFFTLSSS